MDQRHVVIYGFSKNDIAVVIDHFAQALPDYIKIQHNTYGMLTHITLEGRHKRMLYHSKLGNGI